MTSAEQPGKKNHLTGKPQDHYEHLAIALALSFAFTSCGATDTPHSPPAQSPPIEAPSEYPQALHGAWMPEQIGCLTPINYDSEQLLLIEANILGEYENTSKPLHVEQVAQQPLQWNILSTFSTGTGEYEGEANIGFTLREGGRLTIQTDDSVSTYIKCKE